MQFLPEELRNYNRKSGFEIDTRFNPALYSPEVAQLVTSYDPFFNDGDIVICMYDVFIRGKNPELNPNEERRNIVSDDIYWCFANEVVGKIENYGTDQERLIPKPGSCFVKGYNTIREEEKLKAPAERKFILEIPKAMGDYATYMLTGELGTLKELKKDVDAVMDDRDRCSWIERPFWSEILAANPLPGEDFPDHLNWALIQGGMFVPITYKDLHWIEIQDIYFLSDRPLFKN